ncbi:hypothetical protein LZ017_04005 [Pelomonas sp. CA6]|uniref:hypothetical protein n=1 Tax=Pelomonas sp. CA6 TaxID=2907999 RepID=UPI001F4B7EB8|nr:hypothetical protein [Pelomonas sp. CA6]MCH7342542.1 hypothetical protein [Pelomonas sp. CA6]
MRRVLALLFSVAVLSPVMASPQLDQIKQNAKFVADRFGPASGVASFGCNGDSVAYLDAFISRQAGTITKDAQSQDRFISLFGAFLGECIVSTYGGAWVEAKNSIHLEVPANGKVNIVQPFHKVAKRVQFGESESLLVYFRDLLPAALGKPASAPVSK